MTVVLLVFLSINLLIKSIFLPIEVAMDTVLTCGLDDFEVNGNSNRPYYMSDKLKEMILENRSSQLDSLSPPNEAIGITISRFSSEDEQNNQPSNSIEN
uniref:Uncharacterized protein n=1 Tax=Trichogramma kaykai TaxID=54128 RepID=A0ABD2WWQ3_9HYME